MRACLLLGLLLAGRWAHAATPGPPGGGEQTIRSRSGQFVVTGLPLPPPSEAAPLPTSPWVALDPNLLTVSCERIKQAFLTELADRDALRGRIVIGINPAMTNNQPPIIGARQFIDGWLYRMEVPREIEPLKLVRGTVGVLLLELANRNAGGRSAVIPPWLAEGLTQHLFNNSETPLVVSNPRYTMNRVSVNTFARQAIRQDPLRDSRARLSTHAPLSFSRLGDPAPEEMPQETWRTFQACAQLFVHQLLQLPGGRQGVTHFLLLLPQHLNWQSAFTSAFSRRFPRLLDVEKWWAVLLVHFTGLDAMNAWSRDVAVLKLDEAIHPPVLVSPSRREMAQRTRMSLQQMISQWDYLRQRILLRQVVDQLVPLRLRMPPDMVPLVDEYREVLGAYVAQRDRTGAGRAASGIPATRADALVKETVRRLDEIDAKRLAFGNPAATTAASPMRTSPPPGSATPARR